MVAYRVIGTSVQRVNGVDKVTGEALYTADVSLPGTLFGKTLHSPYSHARILSIDTSAAKALPGVHAVLTGEDVVTGGMYGRRIKDVPNLARGGVRYFGERVAAVAADDEDIAQRALDLIEVEYEELPAVFNPFAAMEDDAPILHPDFASYTGGRALPKPSNVYAETSTDRGNVDEGFAAADAVVENTYYLSRVHQGYMEPHSVVVNVEGEHVQMWTCSKVPYNIRDCLAEAAQIPAESIVVEHSYIGGDFGGKATPGDLPACYFLSKATGRPVRMVMDYLEELMAGDPRHSVVVRMKTGVKSDGTMLAHQVHFIVNSGAYAGYKPAGVIGGAQAAAGLYRVPNVRITTTHVYTNTVPGGHMRAPGEPQGNFAGESHIDEVARAIGMDPLAFRLQNLMNDGEETAAGQKPAGFRGAEILSKAAQAAGYDAPKAPYVGRGMAVGDRGAGGGESNLIITLNPDGSVNLDTGVFDQGVGTYTTVQQIVAEEFGVEPDRVFVSVGNTEAFVFDSGLGGSRGTRVNSAVAHEAVMETRRLVRLAASEHFGVPEDTFAVDADGNVRRYDTEESTPWPQLLTQIGHSVSGQAHFNATGRSPESEFAAQLAEVSVDPETGEVKVLSFTTAHDVGQILNPVGHQGQINGAFMQGYGYALMEELKVEDGRVVTLSLGDYKLPTMRDIPPLHTILVPSHEGDGPYKTKGIGENAIGSVAPAIANAVADAIGVRIRDLPITSEKVYRALQQKRSS